MSDDLIPEPEVPPVEPTVEPEPFTLPEDFATQVQGWELELDKLPEAVETYKRLQTEEGVIDGFISMGQQLGFGIKELNKLFAEEETPAPAAPAAPAPEPLDPERLMTAAEVEELLGKQREELVTFRQEQEQASAQAKQQQVYNAMDSWFEAQGVSDQDTRFAIAKRGEKHVLQGQDGYDPRVAIAALERGKVEYDAWVEAEAQAYLKKKQTAANGQPTALGGAPTHGGGGEDAAPDYSKLGRGALDVARERVRQRLRENGEL